MNNGHNAIQNVLFVCLGNICRSPMAEGILKNKIDNLGLNDRYVVDSAGIGNWHSGEQPDPRMRATALEKGIELNSLARQVTSKDFKKFDLLIAMDRSNYSELLIMANDEEERSRVTLMRKFDPIASDDLNVPDPYFGGDEGFEDVYFMLERSCKNLLEYLQNVENT